MVNVRMYTSEHAGVCYGESDQDTNYQRILGKMQSPFVSVMDGGEMQKIHFKGSKPGWESVLHSQRFELVDVGTSIFGRNTLLL